MKKYNNYYLTNLRVVKGKLYNYIELIYFKFNKIKFSTIPDYTFIKSFDKYSDKQFSNTIGLYKNNKSGKEVIIRRFYYRFKNLKFEQIINEYNIINFLSKFKNIKIDKYKIIFPHLIKFEVNDKEILLIREYLKGKQIKFINEKDKLKIISNVLSTFPLISESISKKDRKIISKRSFIYTLVAFPIALVRSILKDPLRIVLYSKLSLQLYSQLFFIQKKHKYILSHRDLHSGNIIINKNTINIIDSEITVLGEEDTDLAIISRYYINEVDKKMLNQFIISRIKNKHSFIRLAIFYSFQVLANEPTKSKDYKYTIKYLEKFLPEIIKSIN